MTGGVAAEFEIQRTVVDGVPVFWTPVDGPRVAALMFRTGRSDELPVQGGITHLVEHLALAPLRQQAYGHNGFVSATRTVFHASGSDDEIVSFLEMVCTNLGALPLDRVGLERQILLQESSSSNQTAGATIRWFRFGNRGHGLVGTPELGLGWLGPDAVQAWSRAVFTSGNAAVWLNGPPPATLRLPLQSGESQPAVSLDPISDVRLPAYARWQGPGVTISFFLRRSSAARVVLDVMARRIRETLRFERGRIYDVHVDYEPVDATFAHCVVGADCQPEHSAEVLAEFLDVLSALGRDGATEAEIERLVRDFVEHTALPPNRMGFLDGTAFDHLVQRQRESPAQIIAEYRAVTPAATATVVADGLVTLFVLAPSDMPGERGLHDYPSWSSVRIVGREFSPPGLPFGRNARKDRLSIGADGVTWRAADGSLLTVRYDECVAVRHWDDTVRELWGADGFRVRVAAEDWRNGAAAVALVDAAIDPALIACDTHGIGALKVT